MRRGCSATATQNVPPIAGSALSTSAESRMPTTASASRPAALTATASARRDGATALVLTGKREPVRASIAAPTGTSQKSCAAANGAPSATATIGTRNRFIVGLSVAVDSAG